MATRQASSFSAWIRLASSVGCGAAIGLVLWYATSLEFLAPKDLPRVFVGSSCSASEQAVEALVGAEVVLVPSGTERGANTTACAHTVELLDRRGYLWLKAIGEAWLCDRFAAYGNVWLAENSGGAVPAFLVGEEVSIGLNDARLEQVLSGH